MSFDQIKQNAIAEWEKLKGSDKPSIYVSTSTCGADIEAAAVLSRVRQYLQEKNIAANIIEVGSLGLCYLEPVIQIRKPGQPGVFYKQVSPEIAAEILEAYLINNNPLTGEAFARTPEAEIEGIQELSTIPFMKLQQRIAMRNCGFIDPENINHYIAAGGYTGLAISLEMTPDQLIDEIEKSGLRGRGGAGFSTGKKWKTCRAAGGKEKFVICNANEGDPGAFSTRVLLESDPHSVLEGMVIAAFAAGAGNGIIYLNSDYTKAQDRIEAALRQMRDFGLLGQNILDSGFNFDIEIRMGAGSFICGEETALIRSLEGKRGMPYPRPEYPATSGYNGKPTLINTAETLADVSAMLVKGEGWFAVYGTEKSKGTKLFNLGGKVARTGIIEVPFNTTLRQIIFDIGGGIPGGNEFKSVLAGGPAGAFLGEASLDKPVDYESLAALGAALGSASLTVLDNEDCIVDSTKKAMSFNKAESCGECVVCREGTAQVVEFLDDISKGKSKPEEVDLLLDLGELMKMASLCGMGKTASNVIVSSINNFRDEYNAHIARKRCSAKVCEGLIAFHILPDTCTGCGACMKACEAAAIAGGDKMIHVVDQVKCTKCGKCLEVCQPRALTKVSGRIPPGPKEPVPVGSWES